MTLPNALRPSAILVVALLSGTAFAADGETDNSAVARWEADKTVIFDASEVNLDDFKWIARPVIVFADSEAVPAYRTQLELLKARMDELVLRDVILITDTSPAERSDIRKKLRPRGFMLTVIGKDGGIKLRKPFPWDVRELSRQIDKMPIRQQEIRDRLEAE
ncbi:MAG: DUF4174 domain-containing protein [Silicimonas sp.]|nr:DUF4174 domain-containing protein [Silicimonas sp.]